MKAAKSGSRVARWVRTSAVVLFVALAWTPSALAALNASLDRYNIAMGDTVRLTLSSDDDRDPADADLSGLREYFEVLQRSSSVSTRIINGKRSQNRELILEISPLREGSIVVPPFEVDGQRSEALAVTVSPPPQATVADEVVTFEAEIDRSDMFVQGQLLLTFRIQQAVNLESRSISELELENAFVESLGQNSFQRMIDGRPWLVHEIRYAIFPEASGELRIPAQTFSGRMGNGRRTLFDTRPSGRLIRRESEEIVVRVKPRPDSYPDGTWLPASRVTLDEQWSAPIDQMQTGDSVTRSITITGEGLQGAQLPPITMGEIDGLRSYPDQASIDNVNGDAGVTGIRSESLALVAVNAGEYVIPAIEIPWWDTQSNSLRVARLPERRLRVLPPPNSAIDPTNIVQAEVPVTAPATSDASFWPWVAAFCAIGWLGTTFFWWYGVRTGRSRQLSASAAPASGSPRALLAACKSNDSRAAERELRAWVKGKGHQGSVQNWVRQNGTAALQQAVAELETCLYGSAGTHGDDDRWDGSALASAIGTMEAGNAARAGQGNGSSLPSLYPS